MLKVALTSMAMVAGLTTAGFAQDLDRLSTNELVELANQEGSVTVYSFTSRISKVEAAFEAAYPNIDLQGYDISSTEQIARLKAEAAAGIANADVIYISDVPVVLSDPELQSGARTICTAAHV